MKSVTFSKHLMNMETAKMGQLSPSDLTCQTTSNVQPVSLF